MTPWLLIPFTLPMVVQSAVLALLTIPLWEQPFFRNGKLIVIWREWWDEKWRYTTCIGYVMGVSRFQVGDAATDFHEEVHTHQAEDLAVVATLVALGVLLASVNDGWSTWPIALTIYATGGPLWQVFNFITALRFRKAGKGLGWKTWNTMYMFSEHERSAYAQTAVWRRNGGGR